MKKRLAFLCMFTFCLFFLVDVSLAEKEEDVETKPKMSFSAISDTHIRDSSFSHNKLLAALQDLYEVDSEADALVINGDITNTGFPEEYSILRELLDQSPIPMNTFMSIGNHEFFHEEGNDVSIQRFTDFINEDYVYYEKIVKEYSFIFLGSESWGPVDSPTKDAAFISNEQLNWFKDTLQKRSNNNKPIFVFLHQPLRDTYGEGDERLEEVLSSYPQAILFSSHTHRDMRKPHTNMSEEEGFPVVNTASTYYTTFWPTQNWDESQGLYVQVFDHGVEINGRDFSRKQWIPEAYYKIDIPTETTFSFEGQYFYPGESNLFISNFNNYGSQEIVDADFNLEVPDGWTVEAVSDSHFRSISPGNSVDIHWLVTPPKEFKPGFVTLNESASFIYGEKRRQAEISTAPITRVVPSPPTADSYLSDMEWTDALNHWAPVQRDKSIDGNPMTIDGVEFEKGLGVHALSEISFYLGGHFSTFTGNVGIDDEVDERGSVVFQVWTDGQIVYDSGVISGTDPAKEVNIDIAGANELKLIVTDADDGRQNDHANWANARIWKDPPQ